MNTKTNPMNSMTAIEIRDHLLACAKNATYKAGAILGEVEHNLCTYIGVAPVDKDTEKLLIKVADNILKENPSWCLTPWQAFCIETK